MSQSGSPEIKFISAEDLLIENYNEQGLRAKCRALVAERNAAYERLAAVREFAQRRQDEATSPDADDYEPGYTDKATALLSARTILTLCDGGNA